MPPRQLTDLVRGALAVHEIRLENLRVFARRDAEAPDLYYHVTWGANRHAYGVLRWWDDMQRVSPDYPRLHERFPDWAELLAILWHAGGAYWADGYHLLVRGRQLGSRGSERGMPRRRAESDGLYRSRLVNAFGGQSANGDDRPAPDLIEELATSPVEPRSRHERLLDDDGLV